MYSIQIENLSVHLNSVEILNNINLNIKEYQFLGVIGPNGGGKTTLLKSILGIIKPSKGKVSIKNNLSIGYVPQFNTFNRDFPINVLEVVLLGNLTNKFKLFRRFSKTEISNAEKTMKKLNILEFKKRQIGKLSGGQMQKVLIARAIVNKPNILILDEPTSNVDSKSKIEIFEILKNLNKNMTIILVSHDVDDIVLYVDSIACLNKNLHYHENNKKINSDVFKEKYNCPVQFFLDDNCGEECNCGGKISARKYI
jgi:zinc transport system ATP-binding protein